jgi:hypothetical protein
MEVTTMNDTIPSGGQGGNPATTDPRVAAARACLASTQQIDVTTQTRGGLLRLAAELQRQLTQVLAAVTEMEFTLADAESAEDDRAATHIDEDGVWLIPADALTVMDALTDAARWQAQYGAAPRAARYRALSEQLGGAR